ncbi:UDP-glucose 4-epimerase GalE [Microbacterium aurum]|uniref:UDP-glucose 4-epimerase n=1 Tax=Microbacterium aurum TaxID=36805 RepID=A0A1P8UA97_9MICO|nr:UDP-glucose 4-epimerase GalE [Microbacterium aurum]APZ35044.1 UDP-glucose 4-epimerase GalE [Microbacterium aurum]MBM7828995.1 UDP-glucose 4-epimerase [Microbacterium aurum]
MRVLVTGGAGFIGSHTVVKLIEAGHEPIIVDSFINSSPVVIDRIEQITGRRPSLHAIDLTDRGDTDRAVSEAAPDAVIHFAGLKAVGESVSEPLRYYRNNIVSTLNLVDAMESAGVRRLVFSSSATVYGDRRVPPFREDADLLEATNPYGQTKVMIERILSDLSRAAANWDIALLRYFNPVGAHPSGLIGENPRGIPNNIAPYITQVAVGRLPELSVYGGDYATADGTGARDYIHVQDLADGHITALTTLDQARGLRIWNLGTGVATTVLELVDAFERASGTKIPYTIIERRAGDIASAWADPTLAQEQMGWSARLTLDDMARDAWHWQQLNPHGFDAPSS